MDNLYKKKLVIRSADNLTEMELRRLTDADDETWTNCVCKISGPGLRAEVPLSFYGNEGLPQFFAGMASWWRERFPKESTWEALEDQLRIKATTDAGHVILDCEVLKDHVDGWRVRVVLLVEAGEQLQQLVKDSAQFFWE